MNSSEEQKHEKLAQALRRAEKEIFVPPTRDESILKECRTEFTKHAPKHAPASWSAAFLRRFGFIAAPALILIAAIFFNTRPRPQYAREDINRDGRIDILDAMTLARAIESKSVTATQDQNGDRAIDAADVSVIATTVVRIAPKI